MRLGNRTARGSFKSWQTAWKHGLLSIAVSDSAPLPDPPFGFEYVTVDGIPITVGGLGVYVLSSSYSYVTYQNQIVTYNGEGILV